MKRVIWILVVVLGLTLMIGCASTHPKPVRKGQTQPSKELATPEAMDYVLRAATAEASGDLWQAISLYRIASDYDTSAVSILQALSEIYLRVNEIGAARNAIDRALDLEPENARALETKASICLMQRDGPGLNATLHRWAPIAETDPAQIGKLAGMYFMVGDPSRAKGLYREAIRKYGNRENWLDKLGAIYVMEKNWKEASSIMGQQAENNSGNVQRWLDACEAALAAGDTAAAKVRINHAITANPSDSRAWQTAILIASVTGDSARADSLVDAGYIANPKSADLLGFKATQLQRQKRFADAMSILEQAIALDSTRLSFLVDLGFLAHTLNQPAAAETAYVKALKIDSTAAMVLNNYAYLLATQNRDLDRAMAMVLRAMEKEPQNSSFLDTRGWIRYRLGQYDKAIVDLSEAAKIDTINGEIHSHLGDVYQAKGDLSAAQKEWQRAIMLDPSLTDTKRKLETGKP